jgi:hypothetical protein
MALQVHHPFEDKQRVLFHLIQMCKTLRMRASVAVFRRLGASTAMDYSSREDATLQYVTPDLNYELTDEEVASDKFLLIDGHISNATKEKLFANNVLYMMVYCPRDNCVAPQLPMHFRIGRN